MPGGQRRARNAPSTSFTKRRASCCALAAAALVALGAPAPAPAATLVAPAGSGLTLPAGIVVTPDEAIWVADSHRGVCRVSLAPVASVVQDGWCGTIHSGPVAASQMAFDPLSDNFYVADAASNSGGVWRLHLDRASGVIDQGTKIYDAGNDRIFGLALGPDGSVDFSSKRDSLIRRLAGPAGPGPVGTPTVVGLSQAEGAVALAYAGDTLYLAEDVAGVTRITTPGPAGGLASSVPSLPAGTVASAIATDPAHQRVYVGTSNADGMDPLLVLDTGTGLAETYATGFEHVTGLGSTPDGTVYIADDPLTGSGGPDSMDQSRLFREPFGAVDLPRVTLVRTPPRVGTGADLRFDFSARPGSHIECELDGAGYLPCSPGPTGTYTPTDPAEGSHTFRARALTATNAAGPPTSFTFTIDRTAPAVAIDSADRWAGGSARFAFSADEPHVAFSCSLDGAAPTRCFSPKRYTGLEPGDHTFSVTGADLAANSSPPVDAAFTIAPAPAPAADPRDDPGHGGGPERQGGDRVAGRATPVFSDGATPITWAGAATSASAARCRPVAATGGLPRLQLLRDGRSVRVRFAAPAAARYAKITLRRGTRAARVLATSHDLRPTRAGRRYSARFTLSRRTISRLRSGRLRLAVAFGTCRTPVGAFSAAQRTPATPSRARG
jgi:hypothetical protein